MKKIKVEATLTSETMDFNTGRHEKTFRTFKFRKSVLQRIHDHCMQRRRVFLKINKRWRPAIVTSFNAGTSAAPGRSLYEIEFRIAPIL